MAEAAIARGVPTEVLFLGVETGKDVKLNHVTLGNLAKGGRSLSEFNADKSWLMLQEVDLVIEYTQEVAT